jgi:hypothetical protein
LTRLGHRTKRSRHRIVCTFGFVRSDDEIGKLDLGAAKDIQSAGASQSEERSWWGEQKKRGKGKKAVSLAVCGWKKKERATKRKWAEEGDGDERSISQIDLSVW